MAFTTHVNPGFAPHAFSLRKVFSAIGRFFVTYVEIRSRHAQVEALNRLSDGDLARLGLTRDGIARHVFSDTYYL